MNEPNYAQVPLAWVGPIHITGNAIDDELEVPLATYETPLWPSVKRGARISRMVDRGIVATLIDDRMTRSITLEADDAATALAAVQDFHRHFYELREVAAAGSRYVELIDMHHQIAGNLL